MKIDWLKESGYALSAVSAAAAALNSQNIDRSFSKGTLRDMVTSSDYYAQALILEHMSKSSFPALSEEMPDGVIQGVLDKKTYWVVDPIDGTVNFLHGLPLYAVSAGLSHAGEFIAGAVCLPEFKEVYFTYGNKVSYLNGKKLICEDSPEFGESLVVAGFSSQDDKITRDKQYALFGAVNDSTRGCLRLGSAAASICFVAAGKLSAMYGLNVKIWDVAGALAVAKMAGYKIWISYKPDRVSLDFVVGCDKVVDAILNLMSEYDLIQEKGLMK